MTRGPGGKSVVLGHLRTVENPLIRSGIVLAGANRIADALDQPFPATAGPPTTTAG